MAEHNENDNQVENVNKNKKRLVEADRSKTAADTTEQPDGRNFYCPSCGRYFYTADERNNHGCSI
jgi:hypothetical protein